MEKALKNANNEGKEIKTFNPLTVSETESVIAYMKTAPLIVSIVKTKTNPRQRVIDVLCGAAVALNVKICPLDSENYLFTKE